MFTCTARQGDPVHVRYLRYIVSQCIALFAIYQLYSSTSEFNQFTLYQHSIEYYSQHYPTTVSSVYQILIAVQWPHYACRIFVKIKRRTALCPLVAM